MYEPKTSVVSVSRVCMDESKPATSVVDEAHMSCLLGWAESGSPTDQVVLIARGRQPDPLPQTAAHMRLINEPQGRFADPLTPKIGMEK